MDLIYADIELANPKNGSLNSMTVKALVDTGAITLCIPEHIAIQLQLTEIDKREVTTADERRHVVPYVGPVQISFANRTCFTGALVIGESVLMGAVPMEDMDLVISPSGRTITVNPKSPNIPSAMVKKTSRWQPSTKSSSQLSSMRDGSLPKQAHSPSRQMISTGSGAGLVSSVKALELPLALPSKTSDYRM